MALTRGDFAKAYALVEPARRQRLAELDFARRCRSQRETIGFEARELHIRSCEEHGDEAIAHIVLFGETPSGRRAYRDDLVLHRGMTGWGVVLSPHFGSPQVKRR